MVNQYNVYRKKSAACFVVNDNNNGFVGIEFASVLQETINDENPRYDWGKKIVLSLSLDEIGKFTLLMNGRIPELKLYHSLDSGVKTLNARRMDDGNIMINVENTPTNGSKVSVNGLFLGQENMPVIAELFRKGIIALTTVKLPQG